MKIQVRQAVSEDGGQAVPLLLSAGEALLVPIFGLENKEQAERFLMSAWSRGEGQYGYANHWVAECDGQIAGLITCWHDSLPQDFDRQTMSSITHFYGLDGAMEVIIRSQQVTAALHPPLVKELALGHLAVDPTYRRVGVATALISFIESYARELQKLSIVLDVHKSNIQAMAFYAAQGFEVRQAVATFLQMAKGVSPQ